jgi:glycosyltransferase involved in cell wall biosynthesis
MKILLVAIPNHHFFQWTNQLKESGYEVYWFDITDGSGFVERINWVKQFNGWKLKWKYPFRYRIKKYFPKLYSFLEKITVNRVEVVFENILNEIKPDIVHSFEMKLSGLPILSVINKHKIPFVYSSWGSDMYAYQNLGVTTDNVKSFLNRVDYLITDCNRDFQIAQQLGFTNQFLGVFPGNGGIDIETLFIQSISNRRTICIKGYDDGVGKALVVIKAIELIEFDSSIDFLIFSADENVVSYLQKSKYFKQKKVELILRKSFLKNKLLLQKLGSCLLYIGNSTSDGMPNSLLEAMGMGVFPIQSNPGKVTEEVITHGINGFLIENPNEVVAIASLIKTAIENQELRAKAQEYNVSFVQKNYNRAMLRNKIINLYQSINLS